MGFAPRGVAQTLALAAATLYPTQIASAATESTYCDHSGELSSGVPITSRGQERKRAEAKRDRGRKSHGEQMSYRATWRVRRTLLRTTAARHIDTMSPDAPPTANFYCLRRHHVARARRVTGVGAVQTTSSKLFSNSETARICYGSWRGLWQ